MDRSGRLKRKNKQSDTWECSVCTFQNPKETFKCMICDTRKGTSTRKPKQDSALAYQQQIEQSIMREREEHEAVVKKKRDSVPNEKIPMSPPVSESNTNSSPPEGKPKRKHKWPPKLKNIDRTTARPVTVTYNGVSVVITDYQPLVRGPRSGSETSPTGTNKGGKSVSINTTRSDSDGAGDNTDVGSVNTTTESDVKRCSPESGKSTGTSSTVAMSDRESDGDDLEGKK